jgi:hypothetical protein
MKTSSLSVSCDESAASGLSFFFFEFFICGGACKSGENQTLTPWLDLCTARTEVEEGR